MVVAVWQSGESLVDIDIADYCLLNEERFTTISNATNTEITLTNTHGNCISTVNGDFITPRGQNVNVNDNILVNGTFTDISRPVFLTGGVGELFDLWVSMFAGITFIIMGVIIFKHYNRRD